jgi:hypothetical protein
MPPNCGPTRWPNTDEPKLHAALTHLRANAPVSWVGMRSLRHHFDAGPARVGLPPDAQLTSQLFSSDDEFTPKSDAISPLPASCGRSPTSSSSGTRHDYRSDLYSEHYTGSDPETVSRHLFDDFGVDYAIVNPLTGGISFDYLLNSPVVRHRESTVEQACVVSICLRA